MPGPDDGERHLGAPVVILECTPGDSFAAMELTVKALRERDIDPLIVSLCGPATTLAGPLESAVSVNERKVARLDGVVDGPLPDGPLPGAVGGSPSPPSLSNESASHEGEIISASPEAARRASQLAYGEHMVARILTLLRAVQASTIIAPSLAEPQYERFAIALSAIEAVRRFGRDCVLQFYDVEVAVAETEGQAPTGSDSPGGAMPAAMAIGWPCAGAMTGPIQTRGQPSPLCELIPIQGLSARARWPSPTIHPTRSLVSIVVRSTGRPELSMALDSIAGQTYDNIEVIVVDVLGTNRLGVEDYCGRFPLRTACADRQLPRAEAANVGLDAVSADCAHIMFLDDDDWLLPDHVQRLCDALAPSTDARAAYAGVLCLEPLADGGFEQIYKFNEPYDATRLLLENYLPIHAVLFDRGLLSETLRFDEALDLYEDWDFWIQLSQLTPVIHVDRFTAVYRIAEGSGFGVRDNDPTIVTGRRVVVDKWRKHWSGDQVMKVVEYARFRPSFEYAQRHGLAGQRGSVDSSNHSRQGTGNQPADKTGQVVRKDDEPPADPSAGHRDPPASAADGGREPQTGSEAPAATSSAALSRAAVDPPSSDDGGAPKDRSKNHQGFVVESLASALQGAIEGAHGLGPELRSLTETLAMQSAQIGKLLLLKSIGKDDSAPNYDCKFRESDREVASLRQELVDMRRILRPLASSISIPQLN